jgi:hypothetical protein
MSVLAREFKLDGDLPVLKFSPGTVSVTATEPRRALASSPRPGVCTPEARQLEVVSRIVLSESSVSLHKYPKYPSRPFLQVAWKAAGVLWHSAHDPSPTRSQSQAMIRGQLSLSY